MQSFMKKEDKSVIDVENVETTGETYSTRRWAVMILHCST